MNLGYEVSKINIFFCFLKIDFYAKNRL